MFERIFPPYNDGIFMGLDLTRKAHIDFSTVLSWLTEQAENGCDKAQANLGIMLVKGIGIDIDCDTAVHCFENAADQENGLGLFNLGISCIDNRVNFAANRNAGDLFQKATNIGFHYATMHVAKTKLKSDDPALQKEGYNAVKEIVKMGAPPNPHAPKPQRILRPKLHQEKLTFDVYLDALYWQSACLLWGVGISNIKRKGLSMMEAAASSGHVEAMRFLAYYYGNRSPSFPGSSPWVANQYKSLVPIKADIQKASKWFFLIPEGLRGSDMEIIRKLHYSDVASCQMYAGLINDGIRKFQEQAYKIHLESLSWAKESGIIELHATQRKMNFI